MKYIISLILSILIFFSCVSCTSNKAILNDDLLVNKNDNIIEVKNIDNKIVDNNEGTFNNDDTVKVELNTSEINKEADSKWICENKVLMIKPYADILPPDDIDYDPYITHTFTYEDENADKNKTVLYFGKTLNLSYRESYTFFPFVDTDRYVLSDKDDPDYNKGESLFFLKDGTLFGGDFYIEVEGLYDGIEKGDLIEWAQNMFADKVDFSKYYLFDFVEYGDGLVRLRWTYDIGEYTLVPQFIINVNTRDGILMAVYYNSLFSFNENEIELPSKEKVNNLIIDFYTGKFSIDPAPPSDKTLIDIEQYILTEYEGKPVIIAYLLENYTSFSGRISEDRTPVAIPFIKANNNELDN